MHVMLLYHYTVNHRIVLTITDKNNETFNIIVSFNLFSY